LYAKYWENKLQALTKMVVNYKQEVKDCAIVFAMNRGIDYWIRLFLYYLSSLQRMAKSIKKFAYNYFDIRNTHNLLLY